MKIVIEYKTDNAAFEDNILGESTHILKKVLEHIEDGNRGKYSLRDSNGNTVGFIRLEVS